MARMTTDLQNTVVADTRHWLEQAVIGLNLCPFAKATYTKELVHYAVSGALTEDEALNEATAWRTLSSVPAVRQNRIVVLSGRGLTVPGPRVAEVVARMAEAVNPGASPRARSVARPMGAFDQHEAALQRLGKLEEPVHCRGLPRAVVNPSSNAAQYRKVLLVYLTV